jgi:hypothetical protein
MGRLNKSSLFSFKSPQCPCSSFKRAGDRRCCRDEQELITLDHVQTAVAITALNPPDLFELGALYVHQSLAEISDHSLQGDFFLQNEPPPPKLALFKLHHHFVFYG